ncbi:MULTISPECIES: MetQ/NlpA family ABC transporter substrate-binding protein [unclassified Corynebacterium]|uniref:MetQ/NlpA family ABC transporter substrate-binding protein n=1 Tax=unclassified Corynebacterium TaxID=2624378 RepID=UPI001EF653B6|nr:MULTISPECIES: MetQ/NlpA family ABC transporter substrate-binding protein [unclassified Corynebacterium]MCG7242914.1 MetQ/NlpA family ABC transporter substrate-binding protein [Corynebacterium sp. ACRPS]MCG7272150.1 MetQ/NlpA family ABC transporter substrate-binding protein [Corynebacterium sp. ACRQM]MCG7234257.1 MetQ/NlpA family ABC transporter substrate-binding protein [Corynebacterium sp. ACRPR]MDK8473547.1 MetQ/NlpA family ABC transporter substrate-binding protein [Corynebacterium sp. MSK
MQIRRAAATTAAVTVAATSLVACSSDADDDKTIAVGTTDDAKQAWVAFEQEAKDAGYDIDIKSFSDYNTPNQALNQGELDTNNFQHLKFLAEYNHGNGTNLVPIVATEIVPLALFWKGHDSLDGIEGEEVAIPNDSTNQGRAINVLVQAGLITLKKDGLITPTPLDIDEKKSKVKVVPVDAAQTPSAHGEGTPAIINNSFLERAGIDPATAVFQDDPNSEEAEPYINVFAVREEDADNEDIKKLAELWHSDAVQKGVDEDSAGTSVEVERTPEELQEILDKLEADLD